MQARLLLGPDQSGGNLPLPEGTSRSQHNTALVGTVAVIAGYLVVRGCIYRFFPVYDEDAWFWRDNVMCIPRLGAFLVLLFLNRNWRAGRFDLPSKRFGAKHIMTFAPMALWIFYWSGGQGGLFAPPIICVGFATSLVVGVFEEYAFRGPLLSALRDRMGAVKAILLSNVLFCLYHFHAEPVRSWGLIFLTGTVFAILRFRGISIAWLALIHGVIDGFWFLFPEDPPDPFSWRGWALQAGLLVCAIVIFPRLRFWPARTKPPVSLPA